MIVLLLAGALMFLIAYLPKISKKQATVMCVAIMLSLLVCRSEFYGADAEYYRNGFNYIAKISFPGLLESVNGIPWGTASLPYPFAFESGWVVMNWIASHLGCSYRVFMVLLAVISVGSIGYFAYRNSENPPLSLACSFCMIFYLYSFYILRQTVAFSICLLAVTFIHERRPLPFMLMVLLAATFHRSAIIFLILYPFGGMRLTKKRLGGSFLLLAFCLLFSAFVLPGILKFVLPFFGKGHYVIHFSWNNLMTLLIVTNVVLLLFDVDSMSFQPKLNLAMWASVVAMVLYAFMLNHEVIARSIEFIWVFVIVLIPALVDRLEGGKQRKARVILTVLMLFYLAIQTYGTCFDPYVGLFS